ncbi:MAG: helix-turn-helix domain-containing protein, partial [bacterium]|nr:helix-turn-helix domain-containing protein [bacterium]
MLTQKQLTNLGLSDKEAACYLALLELGPSTVSEIAGLAKINRTTGYDILESLANYGLISHL